MKSTTNNKKYQEQQKRRRARRRALTKLEGTTAEKLLVQLGRSPVQLRKSAIDKIKQSFPIPNEHCILWADVAFDIRTSGVVCTDRGVFIKTYENPLPTVKNGHVRARSYKSHLFYYRWQDFEPSWFTGNDKEINKLLFVEYGHQYKFKIACAAIEQQIEKEQGKQFDFEIPEEIDAIEMLSLLNVDILQSSEWASYIQDHSASSNNSGAHGELVEHFNVYAEKMKGHTAAHLGSDNQKNGPDWMVNGVFVQSKYYSTANGSVSAAFDTITGQYKYIGPDGKPMMLEVAKDQYEAALKLIEGKIKQGLIPGIKDPKRATEIVKKGYLTHAQAVNLAKPGTISSLKLDAATGAVHCASSFGLSFVATTYMVWRNTNDIKGAVRAGFASGAKIFGVSFIEHVVMQQLARTNVSSLLLKPSQAVVDAIDSKKMSNIVNVIRKSNGKRALGETAVKNHVAKILRNDFAFSTAAFAITAMPKTYDVFAQKCSAAEYVKTVSSLAVGSVGMVAGKLAGSKVKDGAQQLGKTAGPIGAAVGIGVGFAVQKTSEAVGDYLYEGDSVRLLRMFNAEVSCLVNDYMLTEKEIEKLFKKLDQIKQKDYKKNFQNLYKAPAQERYIKRWVTPILDEIVADREQFLLPADEELLELEKEAL